MVQKVLYQILTKDTVFIQPLGRLPFTMDCRQLQERVNLINQKKDTYPTKEEYLSDLRVYANAIEFLNWAMPGGVLVVRNGIQP